MKKTLITATLVALAAAAAQAQEAKVAIGISGWTGFAPLTLAKEAGLFKKHGLDVSIKKIPQKDRHLAIASGDIQCAATTVETWVVWNANGVATTQIFQLDKSYGADGMVVKPAIGKITDLKGKTVAASAPGTAPYFTLAWMLKKNGLTLKDVNIVNLEPQAAANAMIAGTANLDAAMTYEPYLGAVRAKPEAGKIIATTLDYPMVMDTFGCTPKFLAENPKAAQGLANAYFDAVDLIKADPKKSFEIMGADVKQSAEAFEASQKYLRWQDRAANKAFFAGEHAAFSKEAARPAARGRHHPPAARPDQARRHALHPVKPLTPVAPGTRVVLGVSFFVVFVAVWSAFTFSGYVSKTFLADPLQMVKSGYTLLTEYGFAKDIGMTVWRVLGGFVIAAALALPLGVAMGAYKPVEAFFEPFVSFARYLPASAFIPLLILWAGIGEAQKLAVIFIGSFFQLVLMIAVTVGNTRRDLVEAAYTLGVSDTGLIRRVLIPGAAPEIAETLRMVLGWAWTYVIVAELIGASSGIGHMITDSQALLATDQIIFGIIVIGLIGLVSDLLFKAANRRFFPWAQLGR